MKLYCVLATIVLTRPTPDLIEMLTPKVPNFFSRPRLPLDSLSSQYAVFMQFSTAVYCPSTVTTKQWDCGVRCQGELEGTVIDESIQDSDTQAAAFVATLPSKKIIAAVFRGTQSVQSFIKDIQFLKTPPDFTVPDIEVGNARIHSGFQSSYLNIRTQTQSSIQKLAKLYPDYEIVFTGHSLGGAMASIAAVDFHVQTKGIYDDRISVITFGQPRVGNEAWANYYDSLPFSSRIFRVVKDADPIAQLPPRFTFYVHGGKQYEINSKNQTFPCEVSGPASESIKCDNSLVSQNFLQHITGYYGWFTYPWFC